MKIDPTDKRPLPATTQAGKAVSAYATTGATGSVAKPQDEAAILGISETELTPKIVEAIMTLMEEVSRLRQELEQSRARVRQLETIVDYDPLVPAFNRRAFVRELSRFISFAERYSMPTSVLYFDLNGMKGINDAYGHLAGDAALTHVAQVLAANVRESDVVGRLGGDEFGVILMHCDQTLALEKAGALAAMIGATPLEWEGHTVPLSVAYGAYAFLPGEDVNQALAKADHAMYAQKRAGKDPA